MYWASMRYTSRPEDVAYCLLGLFDINMPLLYGEGKSKAFARLQRSIAQSSNDQSIMAWGNPFWDSPYFAPNPSSFVNGDMIDSVPNHEGLTTSPAPPTMVLSGQVLELDVLISRFLDCPNSYVAFLNCRASGRPLSRVAIRICGYESSGYFIRSRGWYVATQESLSKSELWSYSYDDRCARYVRCVRKARLSEPQRKWIRLIDGISYQPYGIYCTTLLEIGSIVDADHNKCSVEYTYPSRGVVKVNGYSFFGVVFLYKPGYPRLRVVWCWNKREADATTLGRHQLHLTTWSGHFADFGPKVDAEAKEIIRINPFSTRRCGSSDSIILAGPPRRKITVNMQSRTFLEIKAPELTIEVISLPE
jgi:hypothetical protein